MKSILILCLLASFELSSVHTKPHKRHRRAPYIRRSKSVRQAKSQVSPPQFGEIRDGHYESQDNIWRFSCNRGYILEGPDVMTFNPNTNEWTGSIPGCRMNGAEEIGNGYYMKGIEGENEGILKCYQPYFIDGDEYQISVSVPPDEHTNRCQIPRYKGDLENGYYEQYRDDIITLTEYYCNQGYDLHGRSQYIYPTHSSVNYTIMTPRCVSKNSMYGTTIRNGGYTKQGSTLHFFCNKGYILDGNDTVAFKRYNDAWAESIPGCRPRDSKKIRNGFSENMKISNLGIRVECYLPYVPYGRANNHEAIINERIPKNKICKIPVYRDNTNFPNGYYEMYSNDIITSTKYFCKKGFRMRGKSKFTFPRRNDDSSSKDDRIVIPHCI